MNHHRLILACVVMLGVTSPSWCEAQSSLNASSTAIVESGTGTITVTMNTPAGISGFSYGLCELQPGVVGIGGSDEVLLGADLEILNDGAGPDFFTPAVFAGAGHTVGVVVSFPGVEHIPAGISELTVTTYVGVGLGSTDLCFCDSLGTPPVITTLVDDVGGGIFPTFNCGTIDVEEGPAPFRLIAPSGTLGYPIDNPASGTGTFQISLTDQSGISTPIQGLSLGLAIDPQAIPLSSTPAGPMAALNNNSGPEFFGPNLAPGGGSGYTLGVVISFSGMDVLMVDGGDPQAGCPGSGSPIVSLILQANPADPMAGGLVSMTWADTLGTPPVVNTVVVNGLSAAAQFCDGVIELAGVVDQAYIRGDCNGDGLVNIADAVHQLELLFNPAVTEPLGDCDAACDTNADDMFDSSDAVYLLNYRFLMGPQPPSPFPFCGLDPGAPCNSFAPCP